MKEQFKNTENIILEQQVVNAINSGGIENTEAKELLLKYVDQCHAEADAKAVINPDSSNRVNIEAELKIAELYSRTEKYKNEALEALEDLYEAASQNDSTKDLLERINSIIDKLRI